MRQIKEENQKFVAMKKEKEREVKQLKEKVSFLDFNNYQLLF